MKIEWLGHACFALESGGYRVVLDPYRGVRGYADVSTEADQVLCSHGHYDHAHREGVRLRAGGGSPFSLRTLATFHDAAGGAQRGENLVHILTAEGLTVVHLGDLGHDLSEEQLAAVAGCDALLIPVGGTYTIDARQARDLAERIAPRVVVPMHYRLGPLGLENIGTLDQFLALWPEDLIRRYPGSGLELTADTSRQVAVLRYAPPGEG